jgi:heterodisulfide reductase subunit B2
VKYGFFPGCAYKTAAGYKESVDAVNRHIGIELVEIDDWNCCGATAAFSINGKNAMDLAGRVLALAEAQGFKEIVTTCNACYATLQKAVSKFNHSPGLMEKVNTDLEKEKLTLTRTLPVRHYMDVLIDDVPESAWPENSQNLPFTDNGVAVYYGCQLNRPYGPPAEALRPVRLEKLLRRFGIRPIEHSAKTLCCGASHMIPHEKDCLPLILRIVGETRRKGAGIITTICPMCQFNLDYGQKKIKGTALPVTYFTQVIGLAMGIAPKELGIDKLLIPLKMDSEVAK